METGTIAPALPIARLLNVLLRGRAPNSGVVVVVVSVGQEEEVGLDVVEVATEWESVGSMALI